MDRSPEPTAQVPSTTVSKGTELSPRQTRAIRNAGFAAVLVVILGVTVGFVSAVIWFIMLVF